MLSLVSGLASQAINLARGFPAAEIVVHLLDSTPPSPKGKIITPVKKSIKLENISFSYNSKDIVLKKISDLIIFQQISNTYSIYIVNKLKNNKNYY